MHRAVALHRILRLRRAAGRGCARRLGPDRRDPCRGVDDAAVAQEVRDLRPGRRAPRGDVNDGTAGIAALDRASGATVWTWDAPGGINGWPAVADDLLLWPIGASNPSVLVALRLPR